MTTVTTDRQSIVGRLDSIDMARGLIMFLMALDHVRIFFSNAQFSAVDPEKTNLLLFLMRWVTHYCAPGFFVIAGIAIFIYLSRVEDKTAVARFLVVRGLWLIVLELTVIGFAWSFNPGWSWLGVIWSLGWSFLIMAALLYVPRPFVLWGSVVVVFFHALAGYPYLDSLTGPPDAFMAFWYAGGPTQLPLLGTRGVLYSVWPWAAYMSLGFGIGQVFSKALPERVSFLVRAGATLVAAYILVRVTNFYGNPEITFRGWSGQFVFGQDVASTIISFLNTSKYPPSPQFALMTLGPLCLLLAFWVRYDGSKQLAWALKPFRTVGRVPFFFYILHLYLIHLLALLVAWLKGERTDFLIWQGVYPKLRPPEGYGYSELSVLAIWLLVCLTLYFACIWFEGYKRQHTYWWLRFL